MNRTVLAAVVVALAAFAGCKSHSQKPNPVPDSSTVKPEIDTNTEVSTGTTDVVPDTDVQVPDFSGTPHDSGCVEDHLGVGLGMIETGDVNGGIVELEKGVFDHPDDFDIRKSLGEAYLKNGNLEMAVGHLRAATEQVDDPQTWQELAQTYFDLKDFDASIKSVVSTTKADPSSPEPYRLLARIYMSKGMWKESIDASQEAIARGSDSPWTYNNLGYAELVLGKYDDSIRELEKAVSFDEGVTPTIWNNLGIAYEKKGQLADAAGAYRAALAGNPTYVKAKVNLGRVTTIAKAEGIAIGAQKAEIDPPAEEQPQ